MWVICVYDCPMIDSEARHNYSVFRKSLLQENFAQLQNSLYVHHFSTLALGNAVIMRLRSLIPKDAQVAFFIVTDKQYGMTQEFFGPRSTRKKPNLPEQIGLF
ncbi:MAG: CRISPR-associated endonuclease Cas2 [Methylophilaceae bacterium]|nr:CRISPR-associated endonuclease Cas2 [Methylophilaceae bacterium]